MKKITSLFILAAIVWITGCTTGKNVSVAKVAPTPADSNFGTLVVYSAYKVNADFNNRDPYSPEFSNYKIYSDAGTLLQNVHNNTGTMLHAPLTVHLPAGKYHIVVRANGRGFVTLPVTIEAQQNTVLRLND